MSKIKIQGLALYRVIIGAILALLLIVLPMILSHKSLYPVFFDRYSYFMALCIAGYFVLILLAISLLTIFSKQSYKYITKFSTATVSIKIRFISVVIAVMVSSVLLHHILWQVLILNLKISYSFILYLVISTFTALTILYLTEKFQKFAYRLSLVALLVLALFVVDLFGLGHWMKIHSSRVTIEESTIPGLEKFGEVILDYQNPKILPFREYYNNGTAGQIPFFMAVNSYNMQGLFYRYTNLGKYKIFSGQKETMHHVSYDNFHKNNLIQDYLDRDQRIFFQARLAVSDGPSVFDEILQQGLDRTVIVIENDSPDQTAYVRPLPTTLPRPQPPPQHKFNTLGMMLEEAITTYENNLALYWFDLPEGFSRYLATSIYTRDSDLLGVTINNMELIPAQGKLILPYTFDVQNIVEDKLVVALPRDRHGEDYESIMFTYPMKNEIGIIRVLRYEPDTLELDYVAEEDGWFVMHYPYDKKWKIAIDGKPSQIYKANYSFMAVPIRKGNHTILLQYWPDTYLRLALGLSYLTVFFVLIFVFYYGINLEARRTSNVSE